MRIETTFMLIIATCLIMGTAAAQAGGQAGGAAQGAPAQGAGAPRPAGAAPAGGQQGGGAPPPQMKLTSTAFNEGGTIPAKYTCANKPAGITPALHWTNIPRNTNSITLIVHDLEPRPRKGIDDILHWMVWDMPGNANELPEDVSIAGADLPDGSHQSNGNPGNGNFGYRGPCAPAGPPHHYSYEVFALDEKLNLPPTATRADVTKAMDGHILGHAVLIGLFNQ